MTVTISRPKVRSVHEDVPTDRAWQAGRRLYARCGIHSTLSAQLHAMGARWDPHEKALWIGSARREEFAAAVLVHHRKASHCQAVRQAGLWIALPYGTDLIRARVKELGGIWDPDLKKWGLPDRGAYQEILDAVRAFEARCDAEQRARREAARERWESEGAQERQDARARAVQDAVEAAGAAEADRRRRAAASALRRARVVADSGRIPTGEVHVLREVYRRSLRRPDAEDAAHSLGSVLRLDDGRRAVVADRKVGFIGEDEAPGYGQPHAHWFAEYRCEIVRPTEEELDTETACAGERLDADELHQLVADAALITLPVAGDHWTPVPAADLAGAISVGTGTTGLVPAGRLLLARDGLVLWQHPGVYDTYVRVEGTSRDRALADRFRRALADGPRTRAVPGRPPLYYTVSPACQT